MITAMASNRNTIKNNGKKRMIASILCFHVYRPSRLNVCRFKPINYTTGIFTLPHTLARLISDSSTLKHAAL